MRIDSMTVTLGELADGYHETPDGGGVDAMGGRLTVRPPYQREFVYTPRAQRLVVDSALHGYPLGVFYLTPRGDGGWEVLDGQQRIVSLCRFMAGRFSVPWGNGADMDDLFHDNLPDADRRRLAAYRIDVFVCDGSDAERMAWFRRINIAGEPLTDQEIRNAVHHGPFTSDARRLFSKPNSPALRHWGRYLSGSPLRQDVLRTALLWWGRTLIPDRMDDERLIDRVQAAHRMDPDARPLYDHISRVFDWVSATFPVYRPPMKGIDWGALYDAYRLSPLDPVALEARVARLLDDDEVTRPAGVWPYVLDDDERHLSLRRFPKRDVAERYRAQTADAAARGVSNCPLCVGDPVNGTRVWAPAEMEADHITSWSRGGRTVPGNLRLLCRAHNRAKSDLV